MIEHYFTHFPKLKFYLYKIELKADNLTISVQSSNNKITNKLGLQCYTTYALYVFLSGYLSGYWDVHVTGNQEKIEESIK